MPYLVIIFFSLTLPAYAYIDPAGISSLLSLIASGLIGFFYVFRMKVRNFFEKINFIYLDLKTLSNYLSKKKEIIFFIESKSYVPYLKSVIEKLLQENICIDIISEKDVDLFDNKKFLRIFKFNYNFIKILAFNTARCNILVSTSPDLETSKIKKNNNCKCYYYIFHSLVSTQIIYKSQSFKYFDLIACATSYQKKELEKEMNIDQKDTNKTFLEAGYPFLEVISSNQKLVEKNTILIAPTWNAKIKNYYSKFYRDLTKKLLDNNFKVIFRPHPQYRIHDLEDLINFEKKFISNKNFILDHSSSFDILKEAEFLVTDWSGISFEFAYLNKKPVIFFETPRKIHNDKNSLDNNLMNEVAEYSKRSELGKVCYEASDIINIIDEFQNNSDKYTKSIEKFFNTYLFEDKKSSQFICKDILKRNSFFNETN